MESKDMAHTVREGMDKDYIGKELPGAIKHKKRGEEPGHEKTRNNETENWRRQMLGSGDERGSTRQNDTAIDTTRRTRSLRGGTVTDDCMPVIVAAPLGISACGLRFSS